jgi:glutathione S-transferase
LRLCKLLESNISGKYFFGNNITIVDLSTAAFLFKVAYDPAELCLHPLQRVVAKFPNLHSWVDNVMMPELLGSIKHNKTPIIREAV